jgi:serine/threonine protein phosphatase PrpC
MVLAGTLMRLQLKWRCKRSRRSTKRGTSADQDTTEFLSGVDGCAAPNHHPLRQRKGMLDTPRTTVVAAILQGTGARRGCIVVTRLYVLRDGELLTRTRDHSIWTAKRRAGSNSAHVNRNILFTCLGSPPRMLISLAPSLQEGVTS